MKTKFYLNGEKITRKAAKEITGERRFEEILEESKETFFEDSEIELDWMVKGGILTVEFC
ncbi:MAG: hypothetical protein LUD77_11875 [Clostridiales bacterium]|nr:hypothetical protein [Clostridiales bacterium]